MKTTQPSPDQARNVSKVFLTDEIETHALSGIQLEIKTGEYVSIAGPSGCGKSTLLSIIGLLDTPSEGTYVLERPAGARTDGGRARRVRNRQIGFIFQSFNLIGDLTVYENVELPLTYRGMPAAERKGRVPKHSREWVWRIGRSICRLSFQVDNSSASRSRAPWAEVRRCCWPTSPLETSIRTTAKP